MPGIRTGRGVVARVAGAHEAMNDGLGDVQCIFDHQEMHATTLLCDLTAA